MRFLIKPHLFCNYWQLGFEDYHAGHFLLKPRNNRYCQGWFYAKGEQMGGQGSTPLARAAITHPQYFPVYLKGYISGWQKRKLLIATNKTIFNYKLERNYPRFFVESEPSHLDKKF